MDQLDLDVSAIVFECSLAALSCARVPKASALSRYPRVRRDLALLVDESVSWQQLEDVVRQTLPDSLVDVAVFDVYQGDKIEKGKKSIALSLILQEFSRTLEEKDVEQMVNRVVKALTAAHGAVLRV